MELAAGRLQLEPFLDDSGRRPDCRIVPLGDTGGRTVLLEDGSGLRVRIEPDPSGLKVAYPDHPFAAEALLRAAAHLVVKRAGGLLLHASGVSLHGAALVAVGPSGAGKSTFAMLACLATSAQLLSDEIIAAFPDGTAIGTPFRSDVTHPGTPDAFPIASLLTLSKGGCERIDEVGPSEAVAAVMSQAWQAPVEPLSRAEILQRVGALVSRVGVRRLTFRKDPAVADFVAQWVREHRRHP
ncbi:MAG: hypothetical protein IRZ16_06875 [Myxococcaceae bacterium]|nr:hypothetical protein [Myxococcaceae bacterium]